MQGEEVIRFVTQCEAVTEAECEKEKVDAARKLLALTVFFEESILTDRNVVLNQQLYIYPIVFHDFLPGGEVLPADRIRVGAGKHFAFGNRLK